MLKEYFLKAVLALLVLLGSLGPVSVHAQPGIAEGPFIVNFQAISDATSGLSVSEAESGPLTVHEHDVPAGAQFPSGTGQIAAYYAFNRENRSLFD